MYTWMTLPIFFLVWLALHWLPPIPGTTAIEVAMSHSESS